MPLARDGISDEDLARSARVLWAGVHGIASLSTANKLSMVASDHASVMLEDFVRTFLAGFEHKQGRRTDQSRLDARHPSGQSMPSSART